MYHGISYTCSGCQSRFQTSRALSTHQAKSLYCNNYIVPLQQPNNKHNLDNSNTTQQKIGSMSNVAIKNNNDESDIESQDQIANELDDANSINSGDSVSH